MSAIVKIKQVRRWPASSDDDLRWHEELQRMLHGGEKCKEVKGRLELMLMALRDAEADVSNEMGDRWAVPSSFKDNQPPIYWRTYMIWSRHLEQAGFRVAWMAVQQVIKEVSGHLPGVNEVT